jgi:hypothetical protein
MPSSTIADYATSGEVARALGVSANAVWSTVAAYGVTIHELFGYKAVARVDLERLVQQRREDALRTSALCNERTGRPYQRISRIASCPECGKEIAVTGSNYQRHLAAHANVEWASELLEELL